MATPAAWRPAKRSARAARVRSHAGQSKKENGHNGDSWRFGSLFATIFGRLLIDFCARETCGA